MTGETEEHMAETMAYDWLHDAEDDEHEELWIRMRPKKLPRKYLCIVVRGTVSALSGNYGLFSI